MAYVVAEPCIKCRNTECVKVCPVDCFYIGNNMLVINPDECIDCGACEPECPTTAIFEASELPEKWSEFKELNAKYSSGGGEHGKWPNITEERTPLPGADSARNETGKTKDFDPEPGPGDGDEDWGHSSAS